MLLTYILALFWLWLRNGVVKNIINRFLLHSTFALAKATTLRDKLRSERSKVSKKLTIDMTTFFDCVLALTWAAVAASLKAFGGG